MSRRSQRLTRYSQGDDDGGSSSSGGSSVMGGQSTLFKDGPLRTVKRKSGSMKRLSPAPQLGPSSDTHTSYYSESVVRESYIGSPRAAALARSAILEDQLDGDSYWGEDLRMRRRRGTGGSESSKVNGLTGRKACEDFLGSSSGYSSEDDYAGYSDPEQQSSGSGLGSAVSRAGSFLWMVATSPGRLFGLLYWWVGTTWYRLTTAASLLDVFVLTRRFSSLRTFLWFLLLLLVLTCLTYGAWYFYLHGLQTVYPAVLSWWAAKGSGRQHEVWEPRDSTPHSQVEQRLVSRVHALERRLEALAAEFSSSWQKEALRLERLELRQGASGQGGGGGLSHEDTLGLLEGLVSRREAALKDDLRKDAAARLQEELATLRAEHQQDLEDLFKKIVQASQESEARLQQLKSEWQRLTQESFRENSMKELGRLEGQLAGLRQELAALALRQSSVADQVGLLSPQIQAVRDDVESQFPAWISQFLLQGGATRSGLLQQEEMHAQLQELENKILAHVKEMQGKSAREAAATLGLTLQQEGVIGVSEEQVHQIVHQALKRYSEDRIGMVDYALESGGASVISTRCSETYETKTALLSLFGIPLWYHSQSPRVILQPDVHPGNCWAFQGPQGFAVVRLSARIRPTAVTLEHVPRSLSPNSTISSAPKDFAIFGFDEDLQQEGTLLGKFTYDQDGEPIQTFYFQDPTMALYQVVELRILTNWGHPEYTCIYRFRVHGEPAH
ncbi:SUN domain-containing protein 2 [Dasypus novemcinctus]|uniref:SUN domain-containing protein 2 n=1 Tax=Dasypus novemcinctus TaxID=9361 RepID=UPI0003287FAF|nr:SUN domain-containing protein 2 [Dasypus novemcinctus]XP_004447915.1 SUN domain-containing protein 2 [Dasypus novemcinctus]XP_004447916.1 SUN domain-containing protein 2 [Dasypus novemcinctus]XP_023445747.1 SUN domain-containing protein 2 [Dasypus novemcinctus]XP_058164797.1 SUN domain-containing protein 2 [Dasypus novemcinctus]XP_058164799.1 SUN domain-containing protein 2 [Dasypus novemcinctus]